MLIVQQALTMICTSVLQSLGEAAQASSSRSPKPLKLLQKKLDSLKMKRANGNSLSSQESYTAAYSAMQIADYFGQGPYKDCAKVSFDWIAC